MIDARFYRPEDRERIRQICVETAFFGEHLSKWLDIDPRAFADIFISYNTDYEPQSLIVGLDGDRPVAYLALSTDEDRKNRIFWTRIIPKVLYKVISGEYRLGGRIFLVALRFLRDLFRYGWVEIPEDDYPVEIHLNFMEGYRGNFKVWRGLVGTAYNYLMERNLYRVRGLMLQDRVDFPRKIGNIGFEVFDMVGTSIRGGDEGEGRFYVVVTDLREWLRDFPGGYRLFGLKSELLD